MISIDDFFALSPYSPAKDEKRAILTDRLMQLTAHHYNNCEAYRRISDALGFETESAESYYDLPFLPVSLFKDMELLSADRSQIVKVMTSSGTTGQAVSKIFLDRATAANQQKTLVKIVGDFTGASRMPMIIIDSPGVLKDRNMFSARGAGILGFSVFGADKIYALDDNMRADLRALELFLEKHSGKRIFLFGFTYMVWEYFYKELLSKGCRLDLKNGVLVHGGGWKKLADSAVTKETFKKSLNDLFGITSVYDYYGMVEQTGCIYIECEYGHLHASVFSDIITRRFTDFSICDFGEPGIIQCVSSLPESYPGHSLLTEDEGVIIGEDDCVCGRKGKYFRIIGRLKMAEIRGCSDTYANNG